MSLPKDSLLFGYRNTITDEQYKILEAIVAPVEEIQVIMIEAQAGTGKTFISTMGAKLRWQQYKARMRYIFAPVNEDELGFLPGELFEKEAPYLSPIKQALMKLKDDPTKINSVSSWVLAHSHVYERGVNYENETIIIDEAQNFTLHQLRKIITRCADNCKIIIIGNNKQTDLDDIENSGFKPYWNHSYGYSWIQRYKLKHNFRGRVAQWGDEI